MADQKMTPEQMLQLVRFGSVVAQGLVDSVSRLVRAFRAEGIEITEEEMQARIDAVIANSQRRKDLADADARGENSGD